MISPFQFAARIWSHPDEHHNAKLAASQIMDLVVERQPVPQRLFDTLVEHVPLCGIFDTFDVQEFQEQIEKVAPKPIKTGKNFSIKR